jgi:hypothetical protein
MSTMQLIAPDILEEASKLSVPVHVTALSIGILLWAMGWTGHRFWIVLVMTVAAGIFGLYAGPSYGTEPWLAATLLALAGGVLALSLVRMVAFAAGGAAAVMLLRSFAPTIAEPLAAFLVGGLIALLLFRLWTMLLTSAAGSLLIAYSGLCLAQRFGTLDVVTLADAQAPILNIACGILAFVGLIVQCLVDRRRRFDYGMRSRGWGLSYDRGMVYYDRRGRPFRQVG